MKVRTPRTKKTPRERAEARARRSLFVLKTSGAPLPSEEFVRKVIDKSTAREEELRQSREDVARALRARLDGCLSVTSVARELGMTRTALFRWLEDADWLRRVDGGWCATRQAIADAFVVERGPASIRWIQITTDGQAEIAQRLAVNPDTQSDE